MFKQRDLKFYEIIIFLLFPKLHKNPGLNNNFCNLLVLVNNANSNNNNNNNNNNDNNDNVNNFNIGNNNNAGNNLNTIQICPFPCLPGPPPVITSQQNYFFKYFNLFIKILLYTCCQNKPKSCIKQTSSQTKRRICKNCFTLLV